MSQDQQMIKGQVQKIHIEDDWFEVYQLPYEVYAISEPKHFEEVQSFLIKGKTHSILLDTGMGIGNIKPVVEQLVDGKVIVVNSHFHFDHVADNHRFDEVYHYNEKNALTMMRAGCNNEEMAYNIQESMFLESRLLLLINRIMPSSRWSPFWWRMAMYILSFIYTYHNSTKMFQYIVSFHH